MHLLKKTLKISTGWHAPGAPALDPPLWKIPVLSFMLRFLEILFTVEDGQLVLSMLCGLVRTNRHIDECFVHYFLV